MKKIMFYCQYLSGMGHLVRSTEIVRSPPILQALNLSADQKELICAFP